MKKISWNNVAQAIKQMPNKQIEIFDEPKLEDKLANLVQGINTCTSLTSIGKSQILIAANCDPLTQNKDVTETKYYEQCMFDYLNIIRQLLLNKDYAIKPLVELFKQDKRVEKKFYLYLNTAVYEAAKLKNILHNSDNSYLNNSFILNDDEVNSTQINTNLNEELFDQIYTLEQIIKYSKTKSPLDALNKVRNILDSIINKFSPNGSDEFLSNIGVKITKKGNTIEEGIGRSLGKALNNAHKYDFRFVENFNYICEKIENESNTLIEIGLDKEFKQVPEIKRGMITEIIEFSLGKGAYHSELRILHQILNEKFNYCTIGVSMHCCPICSDVIHYLGEGKIEITGNHNKYSGGDGLISLTLFNYDKQIEIMKFLFSESNYDINNEIDRICVSDHSENNRANLEVCDPECKTPSLSHVPLIEKGSNAHNKKTALHLAAATEKINAINSILNKGIIDINQVDENGDTALHRAVYRKKFQSVELLINKGANITIQNNEGKTALELLQSKEEMDEAGKKIKICIGEKLTELGLISKNSINDNNLSQHFDDCQLDEMQLMG